MYHQSYLIPKYILFLICHLIGGRQRLRDLCIKCSDEVTTGFLCLYRKGLSIFLQFSNIRDRLIYYHCVVSNKPVHEYQVF